MKTANIPVSTAFSGSIPQHYDSGLGPMFFEPFAQHLGERIAELAPATVLELACGTGRLTRHIAQRLSPITRIVATDVNPAMLHFAQEAISDPRIEWNTVDAVVLPYADASFDLVVAQFGVMFYSDRVAAYRETLRVLRPGGRLLFTCWNELAMNPAARITQEVVKRSFPLDTPAFYTVPFSYFDRGLIREEVLSAGFATANMDLANLTGHANTANDASRGLLEGSPIHTAILDRDPNALPIMRKELTSELAATFGTTELRVPLSAWVVEAVKG